MPRNAKSPSNQAEPTFDTSVFLNVPYDEQFANLFVAYVAGLVTMGLEPRTSLEIPGGAARLNKIIQLIGQCAQSVHDLSRVELDLTDPPTPRFNMPFELGIVVGIHRGFNKGHTWFVFESTERRLKKSLSDLAEADPYVHHGTPEGVLVELLNAFIRAPRQPNIVEMEFVYKSLQKMVPAILASTGSRTIFKARCFKELVSVARDLAGGTLVTP